VLTVQLSFGGMTGTPPGTTLEQIDGEDWGEPTSDSLVVRNAHRLRRKPIDQLDVEDLRFLLTQQIGTEHLLPLALAHLEGDPLAEGDHYPGDLLHAVLHLPDEYWRDHPDHLERTTRVAEATRREMELRCQQARKKARQLYGAELDDRQCLENGERDVRTWSETFLARRRDLAGQGESHRR
jgi:hypothetical protein